MRVFEIVFVYVLAENQTVRLLFAKIRTLYIITQNNFIFNRKLNFNLKVERKKRQKKQNCIYYVDNATNYIV